MPKRRPSGDGMFRKRPDKGLWEGRIIIGHKKDGKPIFKTFYGKTQKEALNKLHDFQQLYRGVELTEDCYMPLSQWLDRWLKDYAAPHIRSSTLRNYSAYIRNYINPILGDKQINKVSTHDVQKMYNKLLTGGRKDPYSDKGPGLSGTVVRSIHTVFRQAMEAAVTAHLIAQNPVNGTVPPKRDSPPMKILNEKHLERFLEAIEAEEFWHDLFYTEITTGLRRGEICSLTWDDFDEENGTLKIRRTLSNGMKGELIEEPKTESGRRTIVLPPSTAKLLATRKTLQDPQSKWIFHGFRDCTKPASPQTARCNLKRILCEAGLPDIRFHDLRHTFATRALTSGVDPKTLSSILGHTNASFTMDTYTHVTDDMKYKAAGIVGDFMEDMFGKELKPWQKDEHAEPEASVKERTADGKAGT